MSSADETPGSDERADQPPGAGGGRPSRQGSHPEGPTVDRSARPLDVDGTTSVAIGTALWAVAGMVLLVFFRDRLADADADWWLWTCLAGFGLGLGGWAYCKRRRDRLRRGPVGSVG